MLNNLPAKALTSGRINVVLVEPEIAGNTGAVGRTCVAAGATLWLVRPLGFLLDDKHRKRSGLDYWEHLDLRVVNSIHEAAEAFGRDRLWSFTTMGERIYTEAEFQIGDGLVFGAESRGLPDSWLASQPTERLLKIPIHPEARSLNLSVSAAVGIYEMVRQISAAQ